MEKLIKTNAEATTALQHQSTAAAVDQANSLLASALLRGSTMEAATIGLANDIKQLGVSLLIATGSMRQLDFERFDLLAADRLDPRITRDLAQKAVSLVTRFGAAHQFTTLAEVKELVQPLLSGLKLIEAPQRGAQTAHEFNPWLWVTVDVRKFESELEKVLLEKPMHTWDRAVLETFVYRGKKLHDAVEQAEKLLKCAR